MTDEDVMSTERPSNMKGRSDAVEMPRMWKGIRVSDERPISRMLFEIKPRMLYGIS